ncbi:hypothetical protein [Paenibacillus sp. GM2]|uniref:hypothetical protein n=1 Tax=Paenibacillus sp. GM2 TaxID=1622070 RepID=UPI00189C66BB|nr:hypothetical protein [Paenibacillus sp. GM2]
MNEIAPLIQSRETGKVTWREYLGTLVSSDYVRDPYDSHGYLLWPRDSLPDPGKEFFYAPFTEPD